MFEIFKIICFCLFLESVYGSTHALIGNYYNLNPNDCGLNRLTERLGDKCFKWHKNTVKYYGQLTAARNATLNEVPWIVVIYLLGIHRTSYCTGSVISAKWVITAKHCTKSLNPSDYKLNFGYKRVIQPGKPYLVGTVVEVVPHPDNGTDLALLKLENGVYFPEVDWMDYRSICLPEPNIVNQEPEYVMTSGWGSIPPFRGTVQLGYQYLYQADYVYEPRNEEDQADFDKMTKSSLLYTKFIHNQTIGCKGDSGSPVWQYVMGRAVLVGVLSFGFAKNLTASGCADIALDPNWNTVVVYYRVSLFIDWIKNVTRLY